MTSFGMQLHGALQPHRVSLSYAPVRRHLSSPSKCLNHLVMLSPDLQSVVRNHDVLLQQARWTAAWNLTLASACEAARLLMVWPPSVVITQCLESLY